MQNSNDTKLVKLTSTEGDVSDWDERLNHVESKSTAIRGISHFRIVREL